ncbi:MAG: type II toxin-antitoxin system HipA family toxin [Proteobacteria bacterium]|nr:type II toxin-antitoxin system HipA family toxin [Desulfobacteraceae bacterium]MBU3980656.1 type II toxin-antitoxin system HipA family toxin [Pseudomonadota bacterium]MBU4014310.1 type II toxin-antitoxin system HipA family toxin [Pseudomonadota bacterium]MBU4068927.1 type II toxin-antitoxin system HipA family toxin [Pseudomonadota bacterium]MBU4099781.1 type II toxin-antitoxin system HipA family toxin [Pseudomonadota bacterium]
MVSIAKVNIWNTFVGAVAWDDSRGYATFEFDPNFLKKKWNLSPLVMSIEDVSKSRSIFSFPNLNKETYKGLPGMLADSLPDKYGNKLIEAWLARNGRDAGSFNSVERLCYTGKRGMGALEYEPATHAFDDSSKSIEIEKLVRLAKDVLSDRENLKTRISAGSDEGLLDIIRVGTSAGGARAKAIIAYNEKTGDVRSGQIDGLENYDYWIIKFDGVTNEQLGDPKGYGKIEYAYYLMAKECGINMTDSRLLEKNRRAHFMTKRFDRQGTKKLHLQTLCAIAHFDYNDPAAYSYEQAFQVMRQLRLPYRDAEELLRRMCFNVIARNQDDHTKNISFLMDENGEWALSPAYDVTYAYDPANKWMKDHQMSINGKRKDIERSDMVALAKKMNIKKPDEIIEKIISKVMNWSKYADKAKVSAKQTKAIERTFLFMKGTGK